ESADHIIIEINMAQPESLEGVHDLYSSENQGERQPIPFVHSSDRIGHKGIPLDADKVKGIVFTDQTDSPSTIIPPDEETQVMTNHMIRFLESEVEAGRVGKEIAPIHSGIGSVANAVVHGLLDSGCEDPDIYSEVPQDAVFDVIDAEKVKTASCCSTTLSDGKMGQVFSDFE